MMLEKNLLDSININNYQILKEFKSKKNRVFLIEAFTLDKRSVKLILKKLEYSSPDEADRLIELKKAGIKVPSLYYSGEDYIVLEYIPGPTLLDYLCYLEEKNTKSSVAMSVFDKLSCWLKRFYSCNKSKSYILGDVNYRNFILHQEETIYRVDLEDCRPGDIEEDIGRFCAFGLTYFPEFTDWKMDIYRDVFYYLKKSLRLDKNLMKLYLKDELQAISKRRGLTLPGDPLKRVLED